MHLILPNDPLNELRSSQAFLFFVILAVAVRGAMLPLGLIAAVCSAGGLCLFSYLKVPLLARVCVRTNDWAQYKEVLRTATNAVNGLFANRGISKAK